MLLIKVVHAGAHFEIEDTPYEDEVGVDYLAQGTACDRHIEYAGMRRLRAGRAASH
jgi:hypothetical protein